MKKVALILSIVMMSNMLFTQNKTNQNTSNKAKVMVYYFHGTHRCPGCLAGEAAAKKAIDDLYLSEQTKGTIKFETLNLEEPQNKTLVEKYKISMSTLLIVKQGEKEEIADLTNESFSYGRSDPDKLKGIIKTTVDKMIK